MTWARTLLGLEMFIEDIPQLVLTVMVLNAKAGGNWTPVSVFNATTSAFNFTFNLLDCLMPLDEEHFQKEIDTGKKDDDYGRLEKTTNSQVAMVELGMGARKDASNENDFRENLLHTEQEMYGHASSSSLGSNERRGHKMVWA